MKASPASPSSSIVTPAEQSAIPDNHDDAYAEYVLVMGNRNPLSDVQLAKLRSDVMRSVQNSRSRLIDQHTADMIADTVLDALQRSPTFRAAASYGIHHDEQPLGSIEYRNTYKLNDDVEMEAEDIQSLELCDLMDWNTEQSPALPVCEAGEGHDGEHYVSFSVAPDAGSCDMPSWQQGLIHEIIHHLTGALDPRGECANVLGPTEILARRVAGEMEWSIPDFTGYGAPEREAHLQERNLNALREAAVRHEDDAAAFFNRLDEISRGSEASCDFGEYSATAVPGRQDDLAPTL